jgi:hypothetical protein
VVISSWSVLAATALVFYLCFNAFPSYDDVDSWEGTVKSLSSLCCMGGALGGSATVGGSELEVSREIACDPRHFKISPRRVIKTK